MRASVMKLNIPSALIELGIDSAPWTQAAALNLDYECCDIVNDEIPWNVPDKSVCADARVCVCGGGGLVVAILNICSFPCRHRILHRKQISR